jgi:hypothetical protein
VDTRDGQPINSPVSVGFPDLFGARLCRADRSPVIIRSVPFGRHEMNVVVPGVGIHRAQATISKRDESITVQVGDEYHLRGRLVCEAEAVTRPVVVTLSGPRSLEATVASDSSGRFEFAGVASGEYRLSVHPTVGQRGLSDPQPYAMEGAIPIVVDGTHGEAILTVVPVGRIAVTVRPDEATARWASSHPGEAAARTAAWAKDLQFEVTGPGGDLAYRGSYSFVVIPNAKLELVLPKGRYRVQVRWGSVSLGERFLESGDSWSLKTEINGTVR